MLSNCGAGEYSWESLELRGYQVNQSQRKLTLNIHWKDWCWIYSGHLMQKAESLEKTLMLGKIEGKRRWWQRLIWLDSITDSVDMNLSNLWETVENRAAWHPAVHGVTDQTWLRSWTATLTWKTSNCLFLLFPFVYPHIVPQLTHLFHSHPTSSAHSPKLHLDGQII